MFIGSLCIFFGERSIQGLSPFSNWVICLDIFRNVTQRSKLIGKNSCPHALMNKVM